METKIPQAIAISFNFAANEFSKMPAPKNLLKPSLPFNLNL